MRIGTVPLEILVCQLSVVYSLVLEVVGIKYKRERLLLILLLTGRNCCVGEKMFDFGLYDFNKNPSQFLEDDPLKCISRSKAVPSHETKGRWAG